MARKATSRATRRQWSKASASRISKKNEAWPCGLPAPWGQSMRPGPHEGRHREEARRQQQPQPNPSDSSPGLERVRAVLEELVQRLDVVRVAAERVQKAVTVAGHEASVDEPLA